MSGASTTVKVTDPLLRMTVPSRAENVAVVRHVLAGLAEELGMDAAGIVDLKTIVTEACGNVVVHAYGDGEGPMEVSAKAGDGSLWIVIRDYGQGIRPRPAVDEQSLRLGMPLIAALSSSFEIRGGQDTGTEVRMRMDLAGRTNGDEPKHETAAHPEATTMSLVAGSLVSPIVSRVISMLAARADLTVDRLSDAILIGDAISARVPDDFSEGRLEIVIGDSEGAIEMRIGPLRPGAAERMRRAMELPGIGGSLEALADEVKVESEADDERLVLRIAQR